MRAKLSFSSLVTTTIITICPILGVCEQRNWPNQSSLAHLQSRSGHTAPDSSVGGRRFEVTNLSEAADFLQTFAPNRFIGHSGDIYDAATNYITFGGEDESLVAISMGMVSAHDFFSEAHERSKRHGSDWENPMRHYWLDLIADRSTLSPSHPNSEMLGRLMMGIALGERNTIAPLFSSVSYCPDEFFNLDQYLRWRYHLSVASLDSHRSLEGRVEAESLMASLEDAQLHSLSHKLALTIGASLAREGESEQAKEIFVALGGTSAVDNHIRVSAYEQLYFLVAATSPDSDELITSLKNIEILSDEDSPQKASAMNRLNAHRLADSKNEDRLGQTTTNGDNR